jgi:hypothetical protein
MGQCQSSHALVTSSLGHDTKAEPRSAPQDSSNASTARSSCQSVTLSPLQEEEAAVFVTRSTTQSRRFEKQRKDPLRHSAPPAGSLCQHKPGTLCRQSSWFTLSYGTGNSAMSLDMGDFEYTATTQSNVRRTHHATKDESATEDPTMGDDLSHYLY